MSFLAQLLEKPWLTEQAQAERLNDGEEGAFPTVKVGLRVILAVVAVLFSLSIVIYSDRMSLGDWRSLPKPWLMWLNTAVLVASSVSLHLAWKSACRERIDGVKSGLLAGGILTLLFLAGQLLVWQQLVAAGYFAAANPANAFFYYLTALHGVHLVGGLIAIGRTASTVWSSAKASKIRLSVELCAIYWHFLLVVWFICFGLLLFT